MIEALGQIVRGALERLVRQMEHDLPPALAALVILLIAFLAARLARWLVLRVVKGIEWDLWLRRSGLTGFVDRSGRLRVSRLLAQTVYWGLLTLGVVAALNAFSTETTSRLAAGILSILPRAVAAAAIVVGGVWLGRYLGQSVVIWAVNEDLPSPRKLALGVRALVTFASVVAAADTLQFAPAVFLWAFVLILGGVALAGGLALGLGGGEALRRHLSQREVSEEERSLWNHL